MESKYTQQRTARAMARFVSELRKRLAKSNLRRDPLRHRHLEAEIIAS